MDDIPTSFKETSGWSGAAISPRKVSLRSHRTSVDAHIEIKKEVAQLQPAWAANDRTTIASYTTNRDLTGEEAIEEFRAANATTR
jgi:hypothetical protein